MTKARYLIYSGIKMLPSLSVLLISIVVFFRRIDVFPLRNWDEAWYAEAIKNMASGQYGYLMQFWNGRYYFDHSPLYFWLSTPFFKIFGPGEWQARIISATSAVFSVILIFLIGRKLKSETVGLISAFIFLTTGGVVIRFAHGNLDSLLVCLFLASFYFCLKAKEKILYAILCGVFIGLGILVKSWGIGLFAVFWIFIYNLFVYKNLPKRWYVIAFFCILTFFWWYFLGILSFGNNFVSWFILNPSEGRLETPFANFSLDYYKFAFADLGLWLLIPFLFLILSRKKFKSHPAVFPFVFVSFIYISMLNFLSDKSGWYLIPAYPLIAIVIGIFFEGLFQAKKQFLFIVLAVMILVGWCNLLRIENIYPDRSRIGAELGVKARELIPIEDEVILEDHDFTSFLFYSNQNHIYTLQGSKKQGEWWILTYEELENFINSNDKLWIVTRSPSSYSKFKEISRVGEYSFVRNY